jgi:hypothetical protein
MEAAIQSCLSGLKMGLANYTVMAIDTTAGSLYWYYQADSLTAGRFFDEY